MVLADAVIDIRADKPRVGDKFFVDTNVWRYFTYAKFTTSHSLKQKQLAQIYSKYINDCLKAGASLFWSPLSYSELSSVIEKTEFDLYKAMNPGNASLSIKDFRLGNIERTGVVFEMQIAWNQITSLALPLSTSTDSESLAKAVELFEKFPLDGYDIFYIQAMMAARVSSVITHDIDFVHVSGLNVFTANEKALTSASFFPRVSKSR